MSIMVGCHMKEGKLLVPASCYSILHTMYSPKTQEFFQFTKKTSTLERYQEIMLKTAYRNKRHQTNHIQFPDGRKLSQELINKHIEYEQK